MTRYSFLEGIVDHEMQKRAGLMSALARKMNFAAIVKVLGGDRDEESDDDKEKDEGDGEKPERKKLSVMFSGNLLKDLTPEQRTRILEVTKRVSRSLRRDGR